MMANRKIKLIVPSNKVDMGGFQVRQPLPSEGLENVDPFLLLHHAEVSYKDSKGASESGVGPHPHRGSSPVTFVFKGGVHHRDSLGNNSIIYAGGVQWINSGSGIIHSERPPANLVGSDDEQEFIQLWVNTPAKHKMDDPTYQGFTKDEIPMLISSDQLVKMKVVVGELERVNGPVDSNADVTAVMIEGLTNGKHHVDLNNDHQVLLYLLNGKVRIDEQEIEGKNLIIFEGDGQGFDIEFKEQSNALLLTGAPIKEPVASYGPFVMNNQREIINALNDARSGKMGVLNEIF
ncbi:MAG: pirin family protein [Flavobacteriales bacterium]|nr:pirin family protein [Flavobacteriales bacterium]